MGVMVILAGETGLWLESQETDAWERRQPKKSGVGLVVLCCEIGSFFGRYVKVG